MTEQLKADNAMLWVQKMNEIQSRVREIIYSGLSTHNRMSDGR